MDEAEIRIAAHELALIEVAAFVDRAHLAAALARIREDLELATDPDERGARRGAIGLLTDALKRYESPALAALFLGG